MVEKDIFLYENFRFVKNRNERMCLLDVFKNALFSKYAEIYTSINPFIFK